jgi:hypothetical protein
LKSSSLFFSISYRVHNLFWLNLLSFGFSIYVLLFFSFKWSTFVLSRWDLTAVFWHTSKVNLKWITGQPLDWDISMRKHLHFLLSPKTCYRFSTTILALVLSLWDHFLQEQNDNLESTCHKTTVWNENAAWLKLNCYIMTKGFFSMQ